MDFSHIDYKATRISKRTDKISDFEGVHWSIQLAGNSPFQYTEGTGHFINQNCRLKVLNRELHNSLKNNGVLNARGAFSLKEVKECLTKRIKVLTKTKRAQAKAENRIEKINAQGIMPFDFEIIPPKIEDILYSLQVDSGALDEPFKDWCSNFGYDDDSMKAKKIYEACQEMGFIYKSLPIDHEQAAEFFQEY